MSKNNKFGAFLAGTLFGAALALLYAPSSGEETRTVLKDKSVELKDKAVEKGEEVRVKTEEIAAQTKAKVDEVTETAKVRSTELQERGQSFFTEQKGRVQKAIEASKKVGKTTEEETVNGKVEEPTAV
jgi:gas vesicle protein